MTKDEYRRELGRRLKRERAYQDMSQGQVVAKVRKGGVKMSASKLSRIERGEEGIEVEELLAILAVYNLPLATIFDGIVPLEVSLSTTRASSNRRTQAQAA